MRWGIERVFQQITEVFSLRSLIGGSPEAVVFQCGFCLLLYNALRVVRDTLATAHSREPETVSLEQVFCDTRDQLITLRVMGVMKRIEGVPTQPMTDEQVRSEMARLLGSTWSDRWLKAPAKRKVPARKTSKQSGAHTSVLRAKRAYAEEKSKRDNGGQRRQ